MTDEERLLLHFATMYNEHHFAGMSPQDINDIIALARDGASVKPRPRISKEARQSLEETYEAMDAVGEDERDATALRTLLDWYDAQPEPTP